MKRPSSSFITAAALSLLWVAHGFGQLGVGTITGRITDSSGAVIPGAAVTIVNTSTNFTQSSVSNASGIFRAPGLQPGTYRVTVESEVFKSYVRDNLEMLTGATLPVDVVLEIGSVSEQIEVTTATPLLETETSAAGAVLDGEVMYKLPNYQRYAASTFNFVPGLTTGGYAYGGGLGSYRVAGQRNTATAAFDDGVPTNDALSGTNYGKPVFNSVEEIKVVTINVPAEYSHTEAGVLDVVKRSGTNEFHSMASTFGGSRSTAAPVILRPPAHIAAAEWTAQRLDVDLLLAGLLAGRAVHQEQDLLLRGDATPDREEDRTSLCDRPH